MSGGESGGEDRDGVRARAMMRAHKFIEVHQLPCERCDLVGDEPFHSRLCLALTGLFAYWLEDPETPAGDEEVRRARRLKVVA